MKTGHRSILFAPEVIWRKFEKGARVHAALRLAAVALMIAAIVLYKHFP
jgi:hypothetical protein